MTLPAQRFGSLPFVPVPVRSRYAPSMSGNDSHPSAAAGTDERVAVRDGNPHDLDTIVAQRLTTKGLRYTRSRKQVVAVLAEADRPLTIPDILGLDRSLSQSSAYRNLTELIDAAVVHRITAGDEFSHFELAEDLTEHHHHLVCVRCGRVEDFVAGDDLEERLHAAVDEAVGDTGFTVQHHRLDLLGTCGDCSSGD